MRRFTLVSLVALAALSIACQAAPSAAPTASPSIVAPMPATPASAPSAPPSTVGPTATKAATLAMPNVVGKNAAVAQDELAKAGFTNLQFVADTGKLVLLLANWTVAKQTTKPGAIVAADTLIVITCHKD